MSKNRSDMPTNPLFLNETAWFEILLRCDEKTLNSANLACHMMSNICSIPKFWIAKMRYEGKTDKFPPHLWMQFAHSHGHVPKEFVIRPHQDQGSNGEASTSAEPKEAEPLPCSFNFKRLYFGRGGYGTHPVHPMNQKITKEILEQQYGCKFQDGGHGLSIEIPPVFCDYSEETEVVFATSFGWCSRYIEIDLEKWGIDGWVLDYVRPQIVVTELCNCRQDCGAEYELYAMLMMNGESFDSNIVLPRTGKFDKRWEQWAGGKEWTKAEVKIEEYPIGMRKIGIYTRGKDTQFWAGHYGPKFTKPEISILLPNAISFHGECDFPDPDKKYRDPTRQNFHGYRPLNLRGPLGMMRRGRRGGFNPWGN
ncbi:hypothetical protein WR25_03299 [Diploscapter pachys]|uniref:FBA domain-containing protein n=1 Tax=Diploscapter pachys TaxID=2018661 RepID=A0A2A2L3F2_9BILA|nr:hypothetical protein WR25_03299 [Diploscapter pachys]